MLSNYKAKSVGKVFVSSSTETMETIIDFDFFMIVQESFENAAVFQVAQ